MSPVELRSWAGSLRDVAADAEAAHIEASRSLRDDALTAAERRATEAEAQVRDCMARRHRQWAAQLDLAASEIEEP